MASSARRAQSARPATSLVELLLAADPARLAKEARPKELRPLLSQLNECCEAVSERLASLGEGSLLRKSCEDFHANDARLDDRPRPSSAPRQHRQDGGGSGASTGNGVPSTSGRSLYDVNSNDPLRIRNLKAKLSAAVASRSIPELESAVSLAGSIGGRLSEFHTAKGLLKELKSKAVVTARDAAAAEHRSARQLAQVWDVAEQERDVGHRVALLEQALEGGQEARDLCGQAGLLMGKARLEKAVRALSRRWRDRAWSILKMAAEQGVGEFLQEAVFEGHAAGVDLLGPEQQKLLHDSAAAVEDWEQKQRAGRILDRAMQSRKTLAIASLPGAIAGGKQVGLHKGVLDEGSQALAVARAQKSLELATQGRQCQALEKAIEQGQDAGLGTTDTYMREALRALEEEQRLKKLIEFKGSCDLKALEAAIEEWGARGLNGQVFETYSRYLKELKETALQALSELDEATNRPIYFDQNESNMTSEGQSMLAVVANVLKRYPRVPIGISGGSTHADPRMARKLATDRATTIKEALLKEGCNNTFSRKAWQSEGAQSKQRIVRIIPHVTIEDVLMLIQPM